jgi:gamma-glutamyltranspeptidase/glutathione hydrolase
MPRISRPLAGLLLSAAIIASVMMPAATRAATKQPTATGRGGAIATVDLEASEAGMDILEAGGNAVDAAVAAAAVLGVTEPFSCGIGGGGFMTIYRASNKSVTTIDHRETAPEAMHPQSFFEGGAPLAFDDARFSGLSAGVPGTVRGWSRALSRYGTMSLGRVLQPARRVARQGFEIDQTFFDQTQGNVDFFDDVPSTAALYLDDDGTPRDVGTTFTNPDLAKAYGRIAERGAAGFYGGTVAEAMVEAVQDPPIASDANHAWRPGVMTRRDVRSYVAPERKPTMIRYRGLRVFGMGPPSSGGSTVGEALNILEGFRMRRIEREEALHDYLEASRYSFADRNAYLADPAFFDVPLEGLLSDSFAAERRRLITDRAATSPVAPGDPYPHQGDTAPSAPRVSATENRMGTTTHLTTSFRTPSRSNRPAGTASSSPAGASC